MNIWFSITPSTHTVNVMAVAVPVSAWLADVNAIAALILTLLGISWYIHQYIKEWKADHKK